MNSFQLLVSLLKFGKPHKKYLLGLFFSFFAAILSGASLTAFVPLFDAMISTESLFYWPLNAKESKILEKVSGCTDVNSAGSTTENSGSFSLNCRKSDATPALNLEKDPKSVKYEEIEQGSNFFNSYMAINWQDASETLNTAEFLQLRYLIGMKHLINRQHLTPFQFMLMASICIFFLILLKAAFLLVSVRFLGFWGYRLIRDLRNFLMIQILYKIPISSFTQNQSGLFVSRLGTDVEYIANVVANESRDAVTNVFYLIVYSTILAYLNLTLFLFCLILLPFVFFPTNYLIKKIQKLSRKGYKILTDLHNVVKETISGIRIIRLYDTVDRESENFQKQNNTFFWRWFKRNLYEKATPFIVEFVSVLLIILVFAARGGTVQQIGDTFSSGSFLAFVLILASCIRPVMQIASMFGKMQNAIVGTNRVFLDGFPTREDYASVSSNKLVVSSPTVASSTSFPKDRLFDKKEVNASFSETKVHTQKSVNKSESRLTFRDKIELKNISFSYTSGIRKTEILDNTSFEIRKGSKIELLGMSGTGKSTIFDLIMRFIHPTSGWITLDGEKIQNLDLEEYRSLFGLVQQEDFLFQGTIRENIAFGRKPDSLVSSDQIEKAAYLACADHFIQELPDGYNTDVGNRGLQLSGGQRQRLALARTFLRDPEVILLDEATSALDRLTEEKIERSLESISPPKTIIQISHHSNEPKKNWAVWQLKNGKFTRQTNLK